VEGTQPTSAVIVRVPVPRPLDRLRKQWDRAARLGVPAHVTVLYPFVDPGELTLDIRRELTSVAAHHEPFRVRFERVGRWPAVVFLAPDPAEPLARLTHELAERFPDYPPYGGAFDEVVPHLTVTENAEAPLDAIAREADEVLPFEHAVTSLAVLVETPDGRWHGHWRLPLGVRAPISR
jgi:2'-5' RNA ligase